MSTRIDSTLYYSRGCVLVIQASKELIASLESLSYTSNLAENACIVTFLPSRLREPKISIEHVIVSDYYTSGLIKFS